MLLFRILRAARKLVFLSLSGCFLKKLTAAGVSTVVSQVKNQKKKARKAYSSRNLPSQPLTTEALGEWKAKLLSLPAVGEDERSFRFNLTLNRTI